MEPLLSMTRPMLTGTSSRLKRESFCSALSSRTRKFSGLRPSTNLPRSSRTVVWRTTRFTSNLRTPPCWLFWPGGVGWVAGRASGLSWAWEMEATRKTKSADKIVRATGAKILDELVAGGVVAGFVENGEWRKALGRAQLDFNFAPTSVVRFIAWMISQNILVTQLHANFGCDVRKILEPLYGENATASKIGDVGQERRPVELFRGTTTITKRVENSDGIKLGVGFPHQPLDIAFVVPAMIIASVG